MRDSANKLVERIEAAGVPAARQATMPVTWRVSRRPVAYPDAVAWMEGRVAAIRAGTAPQTLWLLEHPPLYTAGTSASDDEILDPGRFPVYPTGRGGRYTYHGPGQRVVYVMLDLKAQGNDVGSNVGGDVRAFVRALEQWLILTLARFDVRGERRTGRVGIWVQTGGGTEAKIGAIGVRVRRWVTYHGISLNVAPELEHFDGIVPCGVRGHGVTSLAALGVAAAMDQVDEALRDAFGQVFGLETAPWNEEREGP